MKTRIKGKIQNFVPNFQGHISSEGILVLRENGNMDLTVDTGFSGSIALPEKILKRMKAKIIDVGVFRLATGDEVELSVYWGSVRIGRVVMETWFVPGDSLIGMEFLSMAGSLLTLDFKKQNVALR